VGVYRHPPRPLQWRRSTRRFVRGVAGPLAAGTASFVSSSPTAISVIATAASGGSTPYTYQWQRSTTSGSGFSNLGGATSLSLSDSTASAGTLYYYRVVVTDNASATANSNEVSAQIYIGGALSGGGGSIFSSPVIRAA
jgi:hypothetical protein